MTKYKDIELFKKCKSYSTQHFVVNEWTVHTNFEKIKSQLSGADDICMIVEATDAVHPFYNQFDENLNFLTNFFKTHKQSQLIYYSVNHYTEFDGIDNIVYHWIPEYHAYYYPLYKDVNVVDANVNKKFLSLNKRVSIERWQLYKKFYTDNLLEQSLFSFLGENQLFGSLEHSQAVNEVDCALQNLTILHPEFACLETPPNMFIQIDNDELLNQYKNTNTRSAKVDPTWLGNDYFYQSTFCSVIVETAPSADKPNLSEKTFRSICYGHPFIIIGAANTLLLLRDLGFDTYDDIFDNSYDTEHNYGRRILKAFDVIDSIAGKSIDELNNLNAQLFPRRLQNIKNYQKMYQRMLDRSKQLVNELELLLH
jgi:hypothetical protein